MAQQIINVGASANDGEGNPIRTAFIKCNDNFSQLYSRVQTSPPPTLVGSLGDEAGMYAYDSTYFYYCFANYDGSSTIWGQVTQVGNISATQLLFGTTTVDIPAANANVVFSVNGTANVAVVSNVGANISGFVSATGNLGGANLQIAGLVTATGNVTAGNVISLGAISAVGNVSGNYFLGNGSLLTGLPETYANANVAAYLPTYTGNLISLTGPVTTTANVTGANLITGGTITATGNITGGNVDTAGTVTGGNLHTAGQVTATGNIIGGNILTAGAVSAAGNIFGAFFSGNGAGLTGVIAAGNVGAASQLANGTSVLNIPTADGNIIGNISGTANVLIMANTGLYVNALISASGNVVGGNVITAGMVSASGNVLAQNLRASQQVSAFGNIITSGSFVGSGDLNVNGNCIATNYQGSTVSMIGNITGANLRTAGTITATGNIIGGNIRTSGVITATGNIDGANLTTGGRVLATGNVTGGNITTGGIVTAIGNVIGQNLLTLGIISTAGNIVGNNISAGNIQTTGIGNVGQLTVTNDAIIGGNLTVNGNTVYVNVETFTVEDPIISIGRGANNAPLTVDDGKDRGEQLWYYSGSEKSAFIGYDNSAGKLLGATDVTITNEIVTVNNYGDTVVGNLEAQGTVSAVGNVTGGNIRTAGLISIAGNVTGGNITTAGLITATGNIQGGNLFTAGLISATGAITGADITGTSLTVSTGNVTCGNIVNSNANGVGNIGSSTTYFNTVFATAARAQYADLAESYLADAEYAPGTVVMFGGSKEITQCDNDACPAVVGVVSTQPAYLMNSALTGEHVVAVALMGRVPCQVQGPVQRGSLMVSAGAGRARAETNPAPGTIIGKSVESFDGDLGTIEILVGRV